MANLAEKPIPVEQSYRWRVRGWLFSFDCRFSSAREVTTNVLV